MEYKNIDCECEDTIGYLEYMLESGSLRLIDSSPISICIEKCNITLRSIDVVIIKLAEYLKIFDLQGIRVEANFDSTYSLHIEIGLKSENSIIRVMKAVMAYISSVNEFIPYGSEGNNISGTKIINTPKFIAEVENLKDNDNNVNLIHIDLSEYDNESNTVKVSVPLIFVMKTDSRFGMGIRNKVYFSENSLRLHIEEFNTNHGHVLIAISGMVNPLNSIDRISRFMLA